MWEARVIVALLRKILAIELVIIRIHNISYKGTCSLIITINNMKKASPYAYLARKAPTKPDSLERYSAPVQDLNVFVVAFDKAKEAEKNIGAGDPFICQSCKVCLNKNSKLLSKAEY